ncbi:glycosyltransferase family 2 protein, partial [Candidatus Woesearchaeota archaeon]|nr:glycosyltransferase family 2 protein [Candidatus Woesearchaeota archaeon]
MITTTTVIIWIIYFCFLYFVIFWLLVLINTPLTSKKLNLTKLPLVSIGIPAYNEENTITKTIESVVGLDYPRELLEIIVVNDGSNDKTAIIVKGEIRKHKNIKILLINQKNKGKGSALNAALKASKGEFFVSLDADSFIREDALKKLLPHFTDSNVAAVLPLMKIKQPKKLIEKIQWAEYMVNLFYKRLMAILDCIQVTPGPFSVYRKNILLKVGCYSEDNLTEDMELTLRLQKHHYDIKQIADTEVYTVPPKTLKAFFKQRNRWYKGTLINAYKYKNMAFNKNYGDFGIIQMPRLLAEGFLAVSAFFIVTYVSIIRPFWFKYHNYA